MTRHCATCQQQHALREFDLGGGQLSTTCRGCAAVRLRTEDQRARSQRASRIAKLESRRREMIAGLVKIDAEIADLRARPSSKPRVLVEAHEADSSPFAEDDAASDLGDCLHDEVS